LTITGGGATWTNNLEMDGSISVASVAAGQPVIGNVTQSGGGLIVGGSNGPTSGNYVVLTSTNVTSLLSGWTPIATNPFNPDGTFMFTNTIDPAKPRSFFLIQQQ
jgi:hypothetical protein